MATTYKSLYQRVLLRLKGLDGRSLLIAKESVNNAMRYICRAQDFDELKTVNKSMVTADGTSEYVIGTNWVLTRVKDILSIKLIDTTNSRKLEYRTPTEMDELVPYPTQVGEQRSYSYTQRGNTIELFPIPDAIYTIHVYHTQWPLVLVADADVMSFSDDLDDVVVGLAVEMANASDPGKSSDSYQSKSKVDWTTRAKALLQGAVAEELNRPDRKYVAKPFNPGESGYINEYWKDPFVKGVR